MRHGLVASIALLALLTGCSGTPAGTSAGADNSNPSAVVTTPQQTPSPTPTDLTGSWQQTNSNSADSYQAATIASGVITINWVSDGGATQALYWVGSYVAPTGATTQYSWTSAGDVAQMQSALLASGDSTKDFSYQDGKLTYQLTAMGVTKTVEMERQ